MPIYAYRCESCGHAQDVLQKMSDPLLTTCPACGAEQFKKQVTAAGFQLKGSGWYVTDFRGGDSSGGSSSSASAEPSAAASCPAQPAGQASCGACAPSSGAGSSTPASSDS